VANDKEHCGCKYEDMIQAEMATLSFEWTKEHATEKSKIYMKSPPFDIAFSVHDKRVKIFHATPLRNNLYWHKDKDDDFFLHMARKADADIMIYGHTHIPYRKNLNSKIFINAGSVGKPKDGDTRTCVCIVDITHDNVATEFLRIHYDIEKVASAIIESCLPSYFAEKLRMGK
jgi:diadenosine tetraphosphatase ApaH/serine/threonine PP2A family protein phosphatase